MGMGNNQPVNKMFLANNKSGVWHLNSRPPRGACRIMFKGDPAIDQQPAALMAVQIEVHANFTGTTQRQKPRGVVWRVHYYQAYPTRKLYF